MCSVDRLPGVVAELAIRDLVDFVSGTIYRVDGLLVISFRSISV